MMAPGQPLRFDAWISSFKPKKFYKALNELDLDTIGDPIWSSGNFDITFLNTEENKR